MKRKLFPKRIDITPHIARPFQLFFKIEASSSLLLIAATTVAMFLANSQYKNLYHHFWEMPFSIGLGSFQIVMPLKEWINEGLMSLFFFIAGLEIKREILVGELSTFRKAILPVFAAAGGMLIPASIYVLFNHDTVYLRGWAIPMATDIAFSLGILYILGKRVPVGLRVFLSAFAIADDLGAVALKTIISMLYAEKINMAFLLVALLIIILTAIASFYWVRSSLFYILMGFLLWYFILGSGVHSTLAGIIIAMFVPAKARYTLDSYLELLKKYLKRFSCPPEGCGNSILFNPNHLNTVQAIELACHHVETPLQRFEHALQSWVAFVVVPLFALANAGITLKELNITQALHSPIILGIITGLVIGKPVGITLFSLIAVKLGFAKLASNTKWRHIIGAGILGGIGFTMSFFIATLSFPEGELLSLAKLGILVASILAGFAGMSYMFFIRQN